KKYNPYKTEIGPY
ncbi:hypothetical protein JL09_g6921, partial [Pichia kudriavzevii]